MPYGIDRLFKDDECTRRYNQTGRMEINEANKSKPITVGINAMCRTIQSVTGAGICICLYMNWTSHFSMWRRNR